MYKRQGLCCYFSDHIDHYAEIAFPLTSILGQSSPNRLKWGKEQDTAFNTLKQALMSKPALQPPDGDKPFKLFTDASLHTVSAILVQEGNENTSKDHAVSYASRKLLDREVRFSVVEKEMLALVFALQKFRQWIFGRPIFAYTDHRAISFTNALSKHNSRLARWNLIIQQFNIKISYISGKDQVADHLTRV